MSNNLKAGDKLDHEGKQWLISEINEDNEGEVVYHLRCGDDLSVLKESELPKETNIAQKKKSGVKPD